MQYNAVASREAVQKAVDALKERGHLPQLAQTRPDALAQIKELIPPGASVMNGASRTLEEIGFVEYLKEGAHGWNNLHEAILAEKDPAKQAVLRKQSVLSDFYLGSVHAVTEDGEILIASNSGSQLSHVVYTSQNLILVVGTQKIVPELKDAFNRLKDYVLPLEDKRMREAYGSGTYPSKIVIFNREQPFGGRKSHVLFVNEASGF